MPHARPRSAAPATLTPAAAPGRDAPRRFARAAAALAALVAPPAAGTAHAQDLPPIPRGDITVRLDIIATDLGGNVGGEFQISPTDIVPDPTGRLFVSTLGGVVRVVDPELGTLPTPFLTRAQSGNVPDTNGEFGMTGIAFHPDFATPDAPGYGKFYTITTQPASANGRVVDLGNPVNHQDVVTEWTVDDIQSNTFSGTSREILRVGQPGFPHNVVDLAFDRDGLLHISSGDGGFGNSGQAQNLGSVFGKILRIDPLDPSTTGPDRGQVSANGKFRVPSDNPFVNTPGALPGVYAAGLRSPFRLNFDLDTGELWVGDVGEVSREEMNLITPGGNFGWPIREGTLGGTFPPTLIDPVFEFDRDEGRTIIGGMPYRGNKIHELEGKVVFADLGAGFPSARLFYGDPETGEIFEFLTDPLGDTFTGLIGPETGEQLPLPERIISIGQDDDGELFLVAVGIDPRAGGGPDGMIIRLLAPAIAGDINDDGFVGAGDLDILLGRWNQSVAAGSAGDLDGDGFIGAGDLDILLGNWNQGVNPTATAGSATVPEPASLLLLTAGALTATARRRRR